TRATETLSAHFASLGQIGDVVRLAEQAVRLTPCSARMRELVSARVLAAQGSVAGAMERVDADVVEYPALARVAYRAALREANRRRKHVGTDAEFEDALSGAWLAIERARVTYDARGASRLLERASRLPFELGGRRVLLHHAARLSAELPDDRDR